MYDRKYLSKIRNSEDVPLMLPAGFEFKVKPFRHQVVTFMHALHHKDLAILSTMGTGKTFCAINIAKYWLETRQARNALVVCPTTVLTNWRDEIDLYSDYKTTVLHGARAERLKRFKESSDFYIINYEATHRFMKQLKKLNADIIIFDESSRIANPNAKQTQACLDLAGLAKYRYILNGTPVANKPISLWSQFYAVDFGETLGGDFVSYRRKWFAGIPLNIGGRYITKYTVRNKQALEEIAEAINSKSVRYTKEECVHDMPPKTYMTRYVTLPKATEKIYEDIEDFAKLELAALSQNITAEMAVTKFVKALQVTSGYLKTDEGNFVRFKQNPKLEELRNIINEVVPESAMVIWCKHLYTIDLVAEMLEEEHLNYLVIKGDVEDKAEVARTFQNTSIVDIPIIICQIRSGGIGINLHKASYAVYIENEWRLQDRYQSEDRIHRIGQKKVCTYIDLVVPKTIDEFVLKSIKKNKDIAEYILEKVR